MLERVETIHVHVEVENVINTVTGSGNSKTFNDSGNCASDMHVDSLTFFDHIHTLDDQWVGQMSAASGDFLRAKGNYVSRASKGS